MEVSAYSKYVKTSARKMRLIADAIRGMEAQKALPILVNLDKAASLPMSLVLKQAVANAVNNFKLDKSTLVIKKLEIGEGPTAKRGQPVSRGTWHPIAKRTCHIRMIVEGTETKKEVKNKEIKVMEKKNGSKS